MHLSGAALRLEEVTLVDLGPETSGFLSAKPHRRASIIPLLAPLQYLIQMNIPSLFEMFSSLAACDVLPSWFSSMCMLTDSSSSVFFPAFPPFSHLPHTRTPLSSCSFSNSIPLRAHFLSWFWPLISFMGMTPKAIWSDLTSFLQTGPTSPIARWVFPSRCPSVPLNSTFKNTC